MKTTERKGGVEVTLVYPDLVSTFVPPITETIETDMRARLDELTAQARQNWPVKTGRSKAGLRVEYGVSADEIVGTVYNDVPYAYMIQFKGLSRANLNDPDARREVFALGPLRGAHVWGSLVTSPGRKTQAAFKAEISEKIANDLEKRR